MSIDHVSLGRLAMNQPDFQNKDKTEIAGEQFEGYLVQMMVREMRKTLPEGGMFDSQAMSIFMDLFDQAIAEEIASVGGLGFADSLEQSMNGIGSVGNAGAISSIMQNPNEIDMRKIVPPSAKPPVREDELPVKGRLTSEFGMRKHPIKKTHTMHKGIDIGAPRGTPIHSVKEGIVKVAGDRGGYGNVVIVDHGEGLSTTYAHCHSLNVKPGQKIKANQIIATVGSTGNSTGPHLHFEVRENGKAVDPLKLFDWKFEK
jgi:murein DD-endopeptidase MepM/ murein hydrolase activator NlpD